MSLNLLYQNVRGLRTKTNDFASSIASLDSDILCVTETWLNDSINDAEIGGNNFQLFRRDRNYAVSGTTRGGGCLVLVKNDIVCTRVHQYESKIKNIEDIWVKIALPNSLFIYICTVYIIPTSSHGSYIEHFSKIKNAIETIGENAKIIILGDFNLPGVKWVDSTDGVEPIIINDTDSTNALIDMMIYSGLNQFNVISNLRGGILDLVLSNSEYGSLSVTKSDIFILPEDIFHPTLNVEIVAKTKFLKPKTYRKLNFKKANYNSINIEIAAIDWNFINNIPSEVAVVEFYMKLTDIIAKNVPLTKSKFKHPQWFSSEVIKLLKNKEKLRIKWKNTGLDSDYTAYSEIRALGKSMIDECYKNYIVSIQENIPSNIKLFWSFTKNKKKTNSYPSELSLKDTKSSNNEQVCQMFAQFFKSTYSETTPQPNSLDHLNINNSNLSTRSKLNNIQFTAGEVESLLNQVDINKNGGPDGIPNIFLKNTAATLAAPLASIFNRSISSGVFPSNFKEANVMPIFKKGNKSEIINYRPVCILNSYSKIFEKLVHDKVYDFLKDSFDASQHGFMKNKSTTTNMSLYVNAIARNLDEGSETHAIYTDFSKAFDSVNFIILLRKLKLHGIDGHLLNWFETYLMGRKLRVIFNGSRSQEFSPPSGIPQGSVLGPLLFNIFINDLSKQLKNARLLFADDLKLWSKITSQRDTRNLQKDINTLNKWCKVNLLPLNASKCKFIAFSTRRNPFRAEYRIESTTLDQVYEISDLGIIIDSKLKFKTHCDTIFRKALKMLGFVMRMTEKFIDVRCLMLLYNSLIRSQLEYLSPIWSPYQLTYKHKIERIQKKFTRYLFFKLHIPYMEYKDRLKILEMISLEDRRQYFDMCLLHSIIHNQTLRPLSLQLSFRNVNKPNRNRFLFALPAARTYYGLMVDPVARLQRIFNFNFGEINIRFIPLKGLKLLLLRNLHNKLFT